MELPVNLANRFAEPVHRCEALRDAVLPRHRHERCTSRATERIQDGPLERHVCWTHKQAAGNRDRLIPVRFCSRPGFVVGVPNEP